jgi:hypothetical protein
VRRILGMGRPLPGIRAGVIHTVAGSDPTEEVYP